MEKILPQAGFLRLPLFPQATKLYLRQLIRTTGALDEWNSFALQVGGGVDMRIAHRFAVRAIQADWIRTQFPNGVTNVQNTLRLGAGVVLAGAT
jgi:hypothetical protein